MAIFLQFKFENLVWKLEEDLQLNSFQLSFPTRRFLELEFSILPDGKIDESIPVFIYGVFNGKGNRWEDNTGKNNICENIQVHFYLIKSLKSGL